VTVRSAVCLVLLTLTGCVSFTRIVVNAHVREIDTAWIEPGRTTRDEIVRRIGRPTSARGVRDFGPRGRLQDGQARYFAECQAIRPWGIDSRDEDVDAVGDKAFHWFCVDFFEGMFEGGKWIVPTLSARQARRAYDILVVFDSQGVVSLVGRTEVRDGNVSILEWRESPL